MTPTVKRSVGCKSRREFSKFPVPRDEGRKKDMEREKNIICVRRGINGTKYCACDKNGNPIRGFDKLSDVRKHWQKEINWGYVELVRELNKFPDTKAINSTIKCLEKILTSNAKKADTKPLGQREKEGCKEISEKNSEKNYIASKKTRAILIS